MKKTRKILRALHRDLGYLFVGLSLLYGISGVVLNHKVEGIDPAVRELVFQKVIASDLDIVSFEQRWETVFPNENLALINPHIKKEEIRFYVKGGMGQYNINSGEVEMILYKKRPVLNLLNEIHYNVGKKFTLMVDLFAIILIFFALSGLIMVKGKNGFLKRGVWLMIAGIIIPLVLYFLA